MKKGIKKLLTVTTVICLAIACVTFATACNKTSLSLDVKEASVGVGQEVTVTAKASDSVSWESADESIATVDAGVVKGVSVGKTTVTAKCKDKSATCEITVLLEISGDSSVMRYETISLTTNSTKSVTWTSSDTSVLTVDNGTVTAISEGTATVSATSNGVTGSKEITVISSTKSPSLTVDDSIFVSELDGTYTLEVTPLWGEDEYKGNVDYTWEFVSGESTDVATITPDALDDSLCVVKGVKEGSTKIKVSATIREKPAESVIDVTVRKGALSIEVETNDHVSLSVDEGANYIVDLTMLPTDTTVSSADFVWSVYFGNDDITDSVTYNWSDETVAKYESSKVNAVSVGTKDVELSFTYQDAVRGERKGSIIVRVNVARANLTISEKFTIENTNVQPLTLTSNIEGTVQDLKLNGIEGKSVFSSYESKVITLDASKLPTKVEDGMGDDIDAVLITDKANYSFKVNLYTKIIMTKADLDAMGGLSGDAANDKIGNMPCTWDGYFVLGNDISYNGDYAGLFGNRNIWLSGDLGGWDKIETRGFKGVIDGKGFNIDGMTITKNTIQNTPWGFVPTVQAAGIIKNLSFTNASAIESSFISSFFCGRLENVQIQFNEITTTNPATVYAGVVGGYKNLETATVINCFFDAGCAKLTGDISLLHTGGHWGKNEMVVENALAVIAVDSGKAKSFATYSDFALDTDTQNTIALFDQNIWTVKNGLPVFKKLYSNAELSIIDKDNLPAITYTGTTIEISFNKNFVVGEVKTDKGEASNLTYANGVITIPNDKAVIGKYVFTGSYIYGGDAATYEFEVQYAVNETIKTDVDLNFGTDGKSALESTGWVYDLSSISTDFGTISTLTYDGKDISSDASLDGGILIVPVSVFGKTYGEKTIVIESGKEGENYLITLNVVVITKKIMNKTDLDNMGAIAKAFSNDGGNTWDGYFVLGNDISYDGVFVGMFGTANVWTGAGNIDNGSTRGFKGVFNGRGFNIDGLEIVKNTTGGAGSGFIPTLMATGVIKNVSFTNASVTDCGYVTTNCANGATYENIYVQYKAIIGQNSDTATFNPNGNVTTNGRRIFIDASQIETYVNSTGGWARARFLDRKASDGGSLVNPNAYAVGNAETTTDDNKPKTQEHTNYVAINVDVLKADTAKQDVLKTWDTSFWKLLDDGRIVPVNLAPKD